MVNQETIEQDGDQSFVNFCVKEFHKLEDFNTEILNVVRQLRAEISELKSNQGVSNLMSPEQRRRAELEEKKRELEEELTSLGINGSGLDKKKRF